MARVGKRSKTKFVLCKELIILVVVLIAMLVTTICLSIPSAKAKELEEFNTAITNYNTTNSTNYGLLDDEHVFEKIEFEDLEKKINESGDSAVYVLYGSLENGTLLSYLSTINTEAKNREVDKVYLYSSEKVEHQEDKEDEEFLAGIENDEKIFKANDEYEVDLLVVPALYVYKNGELVFSSIKIDADGNYNWYIMLNKAFSI